MYGFPKYLNSRADYENIIADFGYAGQVKQAYQALLNINKHYAFDRELISDENPDGPEPEFRVINEQQLDGVIKKIQFKLVDDPNSKLKQLGFTAQEVEEVINHD
jgi:hypothetical protein